MMIDLEKELNSFEYSCNSLEHINLEKNGDYNYKSKITQKLWIKWKARAHVSQAEINMCRDEAKEYFAERDFLKQEIRELKQKLARYENPDYVLVPRNPTDVILISISRELNRPNYGYIDRDCLYKAMIEAVENDNESNN